MQKVLIVLSVTFMVSFFVGCFKTELKKIRVFDIELEANNKKLENLAENDTCAFNDLEVLVYLSDENVASLYIPSLIGKTYATTIERYFDFTNKIEDVEIYIQDTENDSIEITNDCQFYFGHSEVTGKDQLIDNCNSKMDSYKSNAVKWPSIDFSFALKSCPVHSLGLRRIVVYLEMSDEIIRGTTPLLNIKEK